MATSGSKSVKVTSYDTLKFSWERTSYSTANNTSTISWKMQLISDSYGAISSSASKKWKVVVNGKTYSGNNTVGIAANSTKTLASGTTTIAHNTDGTKTFSYSFSQTFDINFNGQVGTKSSSGSATLDTIPRASTVTATSAYVENQSTITISRKSSSFTHTVTWECGSASGTIATKTSSTSLKWTLPTSLYAQIGSTATSKTVTISCTTYNSSGTKVGDTKTCTLSAKTSASRNGPTLSPTVKNYAETQALVGDDTTLIRYYSTAAVTFGAAAQDSATLKSKKVTNSGKSRTTDGDISAVTSGDFTFTATDSRGYSKTVTKTVKLINYIKPTCSFKAKMTVAGVATLTASGNVFNGSFGAVTNALNLEYRYKVSGGTYSSWTAMTASKSGNTYNSSLTLEGFDYTKTYYFQVRVRDSIYTVTAAEKKVRAYPVWDWGESSFHVHGSIGIDNGRSYWGRKANGDTANVAWISAAGNLIVGGGSYPPNNIYLTAAEGGSIYASNDNNDNIYNLLGAAKAMCHTTEFTCTAKAGDNYSSADATATLIGNCLRFNINATRKSATSSGDITNEIVATVTFDNQGKIDTVYRVDFPNGITGPLAALDAQTTTSGNTTTITVRLCSVGSALTNINAYTCMPTDIKLSAFV